MAAARLPWDKDLFNQIYFVKFVQVAIKSPRDGEADDRLARHHDISPHQDLGHVQNMDESCAFLERLDG